MIQNLLYKNEKPLLVIATVISAFFWLLVIFGTIGLALIYIGIFYVLYLFIHSALISYLKGTAVKITPEQFPDLYGQLEYCCNKLGLTEMPETYLMHANGAFNAFATRFLGRNFVVLFSDVVDALYDNKNALNFYIGHELGHIHRKHLLWGPVLFPALLLPLLGASYSRSREYTCDNYGYACCPSPQDAIHGLATLPAGAMRWKELDIKSYIAQTKITGEFWMSFNELIADYPWLVKRMSRIVAMSKGETASMPNRNVFAWIFALFIPRIGTGASAGGILIVVAIIGILAAIAIPQFAAYKQRAEQNISPNIEHFLKPSSEEGDVWGWHNTIWGMSLSELKEIYPTIVPAGDSYLCEIEMNKYPYDIYFHFNFNGGLDRVDLYSDFYRLMPDADQCDISRNAYIEIIKLMKKNFGTPTSENNNVENEDDAELKWEYPSTLIETKPASEVDENFCPYTISFIDNRSY